MTDQPATTITVGTTGATITVGPGGTPVTVGPQQPAATLIAAGARGTDGHTPVTYAGSGAPSTLHSDGDLYLNNATGDLYTQQAGAWTLAGNLMGPAGGVDSVNGHSGNVVLAAADVGATPTPVAFTQSVGATVWTIPHTLPYRPDVDVYDNVGDPVWADVEFPDSTTVTVTFAYAATGSAVLR